MVWGIFICWCYVVVDDVNWMVFEIWMNEFILLVLCFIEEGFVLYGD